MITKAEAVAAHELRQRLEYQAAEQRIDAALTNYAGHKLIVRAVDCSTEVCHQLVKAYEGAGWKVIVSGYLNAPDFEFS